MNIDDLPELNMRIENDKFILETYHRAERKEGNGRFLTEEEAAEYLALKDENAKWRDAVKEIRSIDGYSKEDYIECSYESHQFYIDEVLAKHGLKAIDD